MNRLTTAFAAAAGLLLDASACGGSTAVVPAERATQTAALDSRFVERNRMPYTPAPDSGTAPALRGGASFARAQSGDGVGLVVEGGEDQARGAALAMVQALLDADAAALQELFAERVTYVMSVTSEARAVLIDRCLHEARALQYEPESKADAVVDLTAIEVRRADHDDRRSSLPPGIAASDLVVSLPAPRSASPDALRRVPCLTTVYVRPGARSVIVGLTR